MGHREYLGNLELLILYAVTNNPDNAYGNSIQDEIRSKTGREISLGAIYTTLERMESKGYVCSKLGATTDEKRRGRPKRFFEIQGLGERAIRDTETSIAAMSSNFEWVGA